MKSYEGLIILGISQLIAFGAFSVKVMWNYKKELGKAQQQIDELTDDVNNIGKLIRDYQHINNQNIGHIQDFLVEKTDYKPPTLTTRQSRRNEY